MTASRVSAVNEVSERTALEILEFMWCKFKKCSHS